VILDALPLTRNGKVDRERLPDPAHGARFTDADYVEPRTELERLLAGVWSEVLRLERVGIHDNFFDLGGHSLLLPRLRHELHARLDRTVSIDELLAYSTIRTLTRHLHGRSTPDAAPAERDVERLAARRELLRDAGR